MTGKPRPQTSSPLIEHLKVPECEPVAAALDLPCQFCQARERVVDLAELSLHIIEIAQDQYGSRLGEMTLTLITPSLL